MSLVPFSAEALGTYAHPVVVRRGHDGQVILGKADGQLVKGILGGYLNLRLCPFFFPEGLTLGKQGVVAQGFHLPDGCQAIFLNLLGGAGLQSLVPAGVNGGELFHHQGVPPIQMKGVVPENLSSAHGHDPGNVPGFPVHLEQMGLGGHKINAALVGLAGVLEILPVIGALLQLQKMLGTAVGHLAVEAGAEHHIHFPGDRTKGDFLPDEGQPGPGYKPGKLQLILCALRCLPGNAPAKLPGAQIQGTVIGENLSRVQGKPAAVQGQLCPQHVRTVGQLRHLIFIGAVEAACHKQTPPLSQVAFLRGRAQAHIAVSQGENRLSLSQLLPAEPGFSNQPLRSPGVVHGGAHPFTAFRRSEKVARL